MRLSVSNIAWAAEDTEAAYGLMQSAGVRGLEVTPGILFAGNDSPLSATQAECDQARAHAQSFGLEFSSMQSLLYGAQGVALFESQTARSDLIETVQGVIALAGRLGIPNLVFGSPNNRIIPEGMTANAARAIWLETFSRFGDMAATASTILALEPNPPAYGANFMVTLEEALEVAHEVNHPAVRVNLDLGALILTEEIEKLDEFLERGTAHYSHVHISVPHLKPVTDAEPAVPKLLGALARHGYEKWVSIEMRQNLAALPAAIKTCQEAEAGL
jgi:sugar phosphate isomerase/epimerase